ncbi:undecaprenyldiphospho-muramoylpentapeptide beta-N-acetylglucosaminyltransferase [Rhizobium sp. L1K21]|uniref:undecaprenyldiphospho-muramoylpentapeptide beta-N-acetylglucosaminyltransferase n=1 Tax=Rhizobium sp. L1K21 TaxID=2954933 RepID=UPI0020938BB2|nr:undecaprenyldiphospho-muramoylpentapeptide beta-N-acetylglucosaminyltransferase [Rhizobium sp. L1K21]MCO6185645.1 undecaprenyldiphospho-muramoylpentapeptide beta-N-acetylglucosaminyltransferase [Rhizobium sp. L1K21]
MNGKGIVMLAAGGTGGHLFPAEALCHTLKARGYEVHLVTDERAERYAGKFPADAMHIVASATIGSKSPVKIARALWTLGRGILSARRLMKRIKPVGVIGFGGYPTVPPLMAASNLGIPTAIHEQNAVMGRANRMLAGRVDAIAGGFLPEREGEFAAKTVTTGNPVRPAVIKAAEQPYAAAPAEGPFNLVVFGGSQGAQFFASAIPSAICLLDDADAKRLNVTQQARPEDREDVEAAYGRLGLKAEISPFFADMAERIAAAHLVICRSGASTVSEISVIGRPALFVPYPFALDHDQAANAAMLVAKGGGEVVEQKALSNERLAEILRAALHEPERLAAMAAAAKTAGKPDAASLLADLVEVIASGQSIQTYKGART